MLLHIIIYKSSGWGNSMDELKEKALAAMDEKKDLFLDLSDYIWDNPELAYLEFKSAAAHIELLRKLGFEVTEELSGIKTAFKGQYGHGHPVVGILGEFDALSNLSQEAGIAEPKPVVNGGNGHGCGHNIFGASSIAGAYAAMQYLKETGKEGTVIYYGCPAEEGGSGKAFMARDGVFDELDCAIAWHPGNANSVMNVSTLANEQIRYKFTGKASHAAASPHLGRSALDAVELMNVGVQFLREHVIPEARIHYAITNTGGMSPNVVQPYAEVLYLVRAPKNPECDEIRQRVDDIARGAVLMTGTKLEIQFVKACSNVVPNNVIAQEIYKSMNDVPLPEFSDEDYEYARAIEATIETKGSMYSALARALKGEAKEQFLKMLESPLYDKVMPFVPFDRVVPASSDVGDVSWVVPTAQFNACTMSAHTANHSWQQTAQGKSGIAHKGLIYARKVLGETAMRLFDEPETVEAAKQELLERLGGNKYVSPIPQDVKPAPLVSE